jgi:hypothetical protein
MCVRRLLALLAVLAMGCRPSAIAAVDAGDGGAASQADAGRTDGGRALDAAADARGALPSPEAAADAADESPPPTTSEELNGRAKHLLEAIGQANPDLANDILLPREAYVALRDASDPGKAWERGVHGPFKNTVARLAKRTKGIERAQFVSFEMGRTIVQVPAKRREWKKPLWHVKHSTLSFLIDGKLHHIDIGELVAWHGAWYVARLR